MVEQPEAASGNGRRPMRIMIFTNYFLPRTGGVEKHIFLFAAGLAKEGHHPTVVTESPAADFDDDALPFPVLRQVGLIRLFRLIASADVIHLAGPPFIPLLVAFLLGKPMVIEHHGYHAVCPNGLLLYEPDKSNCPGHFMRGEYGKCLRCVATNEGPLRSLCQLLLTFPRRWLCRWGASSNVTVSAHVQKRLQLPRSLPIYHGIPDPMVDGQPLLSIAPAPLCFAYVGRLVSEKGLPVLIEAAGRLRKRGYDFRLRFVGDGPERGRLEQTVAEQGLSPRVTFTGFLSGAQFEQATEDVAVVVMPSIWEETAGLAAMEQMMRGRLVIASDIGGLSEIVDGAGLKFAAGNVDQLAACMQRVLDQPGLVSEIGQRARRRSLELFTEDRKTHTYVDLYCGLLRQRREIPAPPKVLIYSVDFWPSIGGIQSIVMALARSLADGKQHPDGMRVTVVTETQADPACDKDLPFRVVRKPGWIELIRLLDQSDVIHLAGPALLPLLFGFFFRKRIVVEHHGFQAMCPNGLLLYEPTGAACPGHFMAGRYRECQKCNARLGRWQSTKLLVLTFPRRWFCGMVHANIAPTHWLAGLLRLRHTSVIWHGVATSQALPRPVHEQPPTFAFLGRLVTTKGVHLLLQAVRQLAQKNLAFRVAIVGDGPERQRLEQMAQALGVEDRVDFAGYLSERNVEDVLRKAIAVVMPSVAGEVFGLVAAEAMMRARLIIVPDRGSLAEVVGDAGLMFKADNVEDLAACMERVLRAPELLGEIAQLSRRRSLEVFREEQMTDAHLRLYRDVIH